MSSWSSTSPSKPDRAAETVLSVSAKSFALSAKVRRRAFLMLGEVSLGFGGIIACVLSDLLVDDLATPPLCRHQHVPLLVQSF